MLKCRGLVALLIILALALPVSSAVSSDATAAWDNAAHHFNFNTSTEAGLSGPTFADNYNGSDFSSDFDSILGWVAQQMGTQIPPFGGDDVLSTSLQGWPDQ